MKTRTDMKRSEILNISLMAALLAAVISVVGVSSTAFAAATAKEIDASVDAALDRFHKQVKGADEVARSAKGLLVMPNVKKAGFIVGGEYGKGAKFSNIDPAQ